MRIYDTLALYENTQLIVSKDTFFHLLCHIHVNYKFMGEEWELDNPLSRSLNSGTRISELSKSS